MGLDSKSYPEYNAFPEHITSFGSITFDFLEAEDCFIVSFSSKDHENLLQFPEGSIFIKTSPLDFTHHKGKLLKTILSKLTIKYESGTELITSIISQLRLEFSNITIDSTLETQIES